MSAGVVGVQRSGSTLPRRRLSLDDRRQTAEHPLHRVQLQPHRRALGNAGQQRDVAQSRIGRVQRRAGGNMPTRVVISSSTGSMAISNSSRPGGDRRKCSRAHRRVVPARLGLSVFHIHQYLPWLIVAEGSGDRSPHGDEFFRRSRVDRHGVVEVALGRAHFQGDREALQHFIHAGTDAVDADDLLFRPHAHPGTGSA